jgi:hypothetical protein
MRLSYRDLSHSSWRITSFGGLRRIDEGSVGSRYVHFAAAQNKTGKSLSTPPHLPCVVVPCISSFTGGLSGTDTRPSHSVLVTGRCQPRRVSWTGPLPLALSTDLRPQIENNSRPESGSSGKWGMLRTLRSFNRQATALSNASFPLQMLSSVLGRNYPFPVIPLATPTRYLEK